MSIASEILRIQQAKQAIKESINDKGGTLTNESIDDYAQAIDNLPSGGGGGIDFTIDYEDRNVFGASYYIYKLTNNLDVLSNAWQESLNYDTVLYDLSVTRVANNIEILGLPFDVYTGNITDIYNDCVNEVLEAGKSIIIENNVGEEIRAIQTGYDGDIKDMLGSPISLFSFGLSTGTSIISESFMFMLADLTPLDIGFGISLIKLLSLYGTNLYSNIKILNGYTNIDDNGLILKPNKYEGRLYFPYFESNNKPLVIEENITSIGLSRFSNWESNNHPLIIPENITHIEGDIDFEGAFQNWSSNNQPLVIPNSVTSIGEHAFSGWTSNTHPLVIPDSVTSIGDSAFFNWNSNNQPLVISNSVKSIGHESFLNWTSNTHPLVIPDSVTSIEHNAFQNWPNVPYIELISLVPPTLGSSAAFSFQNNAPIYVPDESVAAYKAATNWAALSSRIFSINDK